MVTFSPTVPATPDYPFQSDQSRSIQEPRANVSKEIALKGGASAIGGAVEIADEYTKSGVRNELHTGLDQINDAAIARLSAARLDVSLIDQDEQSGKVPAGLESLDHQLSTLDMARKGNRYSQTYIDAQRDTLLKKVRSDHPGYRDYIDETNSKYTREDPANKYITSLVGDINSYKTAKNEMHTKINTEIWRGINNGWDDGQSMLAAYESGKLGKNPELAVAGWVNKHSALDYQRKQAVENLAIAKGKKELEEYAASDLATKDAGSIASNTLDNIYLRSGVKASDYPMKVLNGEMEKMSDDQLSMMGDAVLQKEQEAFLKFMQKANEPLKELNGRSYAQALNPTKLKEVWERQSEMFKSTANMYKDGKFGLAYEIHRTVESQERGFEGGVASNPNFKNIYLAGQLAAKNPWLASAITDATTGNAAFSKEVKKLLLPDILQATTQLPRPNQPSGVPFTMNEGIGRASTNLQGPEAVASYAKGALSLTDYISNPEVGDREKLNLAKYAFSPANAGLLDKFSKESQPDVYAKLYSYGNIKEVHKLGQQDAQVWKDFKTNAWNHFGNNVLHTQLMDLNAIGTNKNLTVHWLSTEHQFSVYQWPGKQGKAEDNVTQGEFIRAQDSIKKINEGLKSISAIAKIEHKDANVDVLQFLLSAGVDPGSLPDYLLRAVANSRKPKLPEAEDR